MRKQAFSKYRTCVVMCFCGVAFAALVSGCATFQVPNTLEEGEQAITVGAAVTWNIVGLRKEQLKNSFLWFDITAGYRIYVIDSLDAGVQLNYSWHGIRAVADLKYRFLQYPFQLAVSFGGGAHFEIVEPNWLLSTYKIDPLIQGIIIGGSNTFYAGAKTAYILSPSEEEGFGGLFGDKFAGGLFAGTMLGENKDILVEGATGLYSSQAALRHTAGLVIAGAAKRFVF
jgi:hypothetical protein